MLDFNRGSEWRRWDLHIHTPETKKNDQFIGDTIEEKWENFYNCINEYIDVQEPKKNITAIGITDYLSIDNYKKIDNDNRLPTSIKLVIPNIELRILPVASKTPVNMHILCNPEIVSHLENRFFSKLIMEYSNTNFNATYNDLVRFGQTLDSNLNEIDAYKKGIEQFVVSFNSLKKIFDSDKDLRENVIIGVSNSTNDGASGIISHSSYISENTSQLLAMRLAIYQFADIIFSANPSDIEYFLGKKENCPQEKVIKECGTLKPCVHGCDAHTNSKIFEPDQKRYCWIKADPTFNGLKQIIYEPEERIQICELKPRQKSPYFVIDRVEYNDNNFQTAPIYFNENLNCIIGGKSTGKSILLQNIASTINRNETEKSLEKAKNKTLQVEKMNVFWADGTEGEKKIIYIPQTYLNKLSEEQEEKTEIDAWIEEILLNNQDVSNARNSFLLKIKQYKGELEKNILDFTTKNQEIVELKAKIANIGTKDGIENEIKKLEKSKLETSKEFNYSENDIKEYEQTTNSLKENNNLRTDLIYTKENIEEIDSLITRKELRLLTKNKHTEIITNLQNELINKANESWLLQKNELIKNIEQEIKILDKKIIDDEVKNKVLYEKIKSNESIIELTNRIQVERNKLSELNKNVEILKSYQEKFDALLNELVQSIIVYETIHKDYSITINNHTITDDENMEFYAEVPFRQDFFISKMSEIYNNRSSIYKENFDGFTSEKYTQKFIEQLITQTINNQSALKVGYTIETAIREILNNWFNIVYRVKMGNDSINMMSPGKKALVFLKILISLAETQCPILIDQPEDDLDNRSIFDELVTYIKKKKKERQIIIVTHNANLVLGCDAEEIIIANQDGSNCPNNMCKFEYRSGSIENNHIINDNGVGILNKKGIQQHICDILEGGEIAFKKRRNKYNII